MIQEDLMIPLNEGQIKGKITKGEVKCNEKYRFKVALLIVTLHLHPNITFDLEEEHML